MKNLEDIIEGAALSIATGVASDLIADAIKRRREEKAPDPEAGEKDKGKEAK